MLRIPTYPVILSEAKDLTIRMGACEEFHWSIKQRGNEGVPSRRPPSSACSEPALSVAEGMTG